MNDLPVPTVVGNLSLHLRFERDVYEVEEFEGYVDLPTTDDHYDGVDEDLIRLARSPIVRGTRKYGVVGNSRAVLSARFILAKKVMQGNPVRNDWMEHLDLNEETISSFIVEDDTLYYCPLCEGSI